MFRYQATTIDKELSTMKRTIGLPLCLVLIVGCGNSGTTGGGGGSGADLEVRRSTDMALHGPGGTVTFSLDVKPILVGRGCFAHHMTPTWNPIEALTANGDIINFLTTTKTEECKAAGLPYVKAGDSAHSFLYEKVVNTYAATCGSDTGAQMPFGGPYLYDYELMTIKAWIDAGAMNN
jgi:hypothetical protein